jgi:hypothetical protein
LPQYITVADNANPSSQNALLGEANTKCTLPDSHKPMSMTLEKLHYPTEETIAEAVRTTLAGK